MTMLRHFCLVGAIGVALGCEDSGTWFKTGEADKDCAWVGLKPDTRCLVKDASAVYAFEKCHVACGACDAACVDSAAWHKAGEPAKDCQWASRVANRCAVLGEAGTYAFQGCAQSCRACDAGSSSPTPDGPRGAAYMIEYEGAREACLASVPAEAHDECPDAFPTYPGDDDDAASTDCAFAIVGAGAGGLYVARRLVELGKLDPAGICLFEASERVGGRTYSVRYAEKNLTVDAGAYRMWPQFTPVLHALVTEELGLTVKCYDPSDDPCTKYVVADPVTGHNIGFASYVEKMAEELMAAGARWFPRHKLEALSAPSDAATMLHFTNGAVFTVDRALAPESMGVILNVPQRPLLEIMRNSAEALALEPAHFEAAHAVQTEIASKLYLYYDSAWWRELGLVAGEFASPGSTKEMPLGGRYHDGDVVCDDAAETENCRGFLLAAYVHDFSGEQAMFFRRYQADRPEPVTIISSSTVEGKAFLDAAHARLKHYHTFENTAPTYPPYLAQRVLDASAPPKFAVLATWSTCTAGAGGAWHAWNEPELADAMPTALGAVGVSVVNEAFSKVQGWAEGSLQVADSVLEGVYGCPRKWPFDNVDLPLTVPQTTPVGQGECDCEESGGPGPGGPTEPETDDLAEVLCFDAATAVHMADGRLVPISEVRVGDVVKTGFFPADDDQRFKANGTVTAVLVHPVGNESSVPLVVARGAAGTTNHPVFDKAARSWVDLEVYAAALDDVQVEARRVDHLYNLEVDGGDLLGSPHSFVVGDDGLVASGLGDHPELNAHFKRQKAFQ